MISFLIHVLIVLKRLLFILKRFYICNA